MKTPEPEKNREPGPRVRAAARLAALALAAAVLALSPAAAAAQTDVPEICPPSDPAACLVRCHLHKRKCHEACSARKKQCLHKVRAEVQTCKLGCRADESLDEGLSDCKRRCVAAGIEAASKQCKAGKPVCMRLCNPDSCGDMCDIGDGAGDGAPEVEPVAGSVPQSALEGEPIEDRPADGDVCVPPVDRECLGACATGLRECARRVHEVGRQCVAGCSETRGDERWVCYRDCAATAEKHGQQCQNTFRRCALDCRDVVADDGAGAVDETP